MYVIYYDSESWMLLDYTDHPDKALEAASWYVHTGVPVILTTSLKDLPEQLEKFNQ